MVGIFGSIIGIAIVLLGVATGLVWATVLMGTLGVVIEVSALDYHVKHE
jgi:hypothetical protein